MDSLKKNINIFLAYSIIINYILLAADEITTPAQN